MTEPLELASAYLRTEEGNEIYYYGGGAAAWGSKALACTGVPVELRKGRTIGVWENGKIVEYIWHTDTSDNGLNRKAAPPQITDQDAQLYTTGKPKFASVEINGGNPTVFRKTQGEGAGSALKVITGAPANTVGSVLDLAAANPDGLETIHTFYSATPVAGAASKQVDIILPKVSGRLALLEDLPDASLKTDKLITFYTTQTANFNIAADMVDKVVRCNHATIAITATIADDTLFAIGTRFEIRQSGAAGVSLASAAGITLNAPQGLALSRRYSYMQVVKQAAGMYSVTIIGDDPTKQDKEAGKGLSTNDYSTAEKTKLGAILSGFNILFTAPRRDLPAVYFDKAVKVTAISLNGASAFSYSVNNGTSYITLTLPLTAGTAITLPATTFVRFRITFASNSTDATAYLKFE